MTARQDPAVRDAPPAGSPPGPGIGRLAAAGVTVAALLLAALLLRTDDAGWSVARGPLGGNFSLVMFLGFCWLLAMTALTARYRSSVRGVQGLSPRAERLKDATRILLPALAVGLPPLMMLLASPEQVAPKDQGVSLLRTNQPLRSGNEHSRSGGSANGGFLLHGLGAVVEAVVVALILLGLVLGLVALWRRRHSLWGDPAQPPALAPDADDAQALADAVDSARRALRGDDVRTAVIACYAAMESSLAESGAGRRAADSPTDLLDRVVASGTLRAAEAAELTGLFREARYSTHPMGPDELRRAGAALDAVSAQLAAEGTHL
ncbi:hypothetical protein P3T37_006154 [Kitasatospora sp. MAA4]|uniref:DUF4129 domain-containing protein n=1 Tax=Kitasatospora sp. MAA4 TaxID=3035093 RepID=UPI002476C728|nr:DUF4129 domain-containing protein [Kitasatospora sp. MAA4]MDH6136723.1 hypothetical protein [Kitasatospora sp. MAA4]